MGVECGEIVVSSCRWVVLLGDARPRLLGMSYGEEEVEILR